MPAVRNVAIDTDFLHLHDWWKDVDAGQPDQCWPWMKSTGSHGYGQTWDGITVRLAHRVAWVLHHGRQIPDDMTIDHICRNRTCVNVDHLRLLTNVENAKDNGMARRTQCPSGHAYDDANTYVNRMGHRQCRACARGRQVTS